MLDKDTLDNPVNEPLNTEMRCGILTNANGDILILHDHDISAPVQWIEYDCEDNQLFLILENGKLQDLGLHLDDKMKGNLVQGLEVTLAKVADKKIQSSQKTTIVIKDY